MNNNTDGAIEGADEIMAALDKLPGKLSWKILYNANRSILQTNVLPDLRAALPYSARTRRGIKVVKAKSTGTGVYVGVTTDAFWLRFAEKGTAERVTLGGGTKKQPEGISRGRISPGNPIAISTIENKVADVMDQISRHYPEMIVAAIAKELKKYQIKH